ncbi:MAG: DNA-directed RNA polymerase subunit omega [Acidimicrobiia bacterium]
MTRPPIEELLAKTGSKFILVMLAAQRARQINDYYLQLGEGIGRYAPPQVHTTSRKPLTIALEEIAAGKITYDEEYYKKAIDSLKQGASRVK